MIYLHFAYYNSGEEIIRDLILNNRNQLLKQNFLYPQATMIKGAHENIYHELIGSKLYNPAAGDLKLLIEKMLSYTMRKPAGKIILSSSKLIYAPLDKLYDFVGMISQLGPVKVVVSINTQLQYLLYLWQKSEKKESNTFISWADNCIKNDLFALNYFKSVQKLLRLVNEKDLTVLNIAGLDKTDISKAYLNQFDIKDRTNLYLQPEKVELELPSDLDIKTVSLKIQAKYGAWNDALEKRLH